MVIKKMEMVKYEGKVYNLGVSGFHNYFANNLLVHNCYQDSKESNYHYDDIVKKINSYFGSMTENQRPFQVACLAGETLIGTPNGLIKIKNLKIGDSVFDSEGDITIIKNIVISKKKCIKLIGNKGWNVNCTVDHPFLVNGKIVEAINLKNKYLDLSTFDIDLIKCVNMGNYINKTSRMPGKRGGSSGGSIKGDKCRLMHTLSWIPKSIELDDDVMWLYGLSVAEGYKRGVSLNRNEKHITQEAIRIYDKIFGLGAAIRGNNENGINIEFKEPKNYETLFFKAMQIGKGARNKSINFLFNLNIDLVRSAIKGMIDGDGCYRIRTDKRNNKKYFSLSYKTSSKKLANELVYLLAVRFNVLSSIYRGYNKKRKIFGRSLPITKYYMVDIYGKENIQKLFPDLFSENLDFEKCGNRLYSNKKTESFIKVKNIKKVGKKVVYDITLGGDSTHIFTLQHGVQSHNCGGGEPTLHPQFCEILVAFDQLGITPNYTTNGMFITKRPDTIERIIAYTRMYCGGVAVSCHPHLDKYWDSVAKIFLNVDVKLNFHLIISDLKSIDYFLEIYDYFKGKVDHFVLLPYIAQGRASEIDVDVKYLFDELKKFGDIEDVAFGANFYNDLKKDNFCKVSLYEPEILSKYLDFKDMKLYPSSFSTEAICTIKDENMIKDEKGDLWKKWLWKDGGR